MKLGTSTFLSFLAPALDRGSGFAGVIATGRDGSLRVRGANRSEILTRGIYADEIICLDRRPAVRYAQGRCLATA